MAGSEASRGSKAGTGSSTARAARGTARARHPTEADGVAGRSWAGSERSAWDQRGDPAAQLARGTSLQVKTVLLGQHVRGGTQSSQQSFHSPDGGDYLLRLRRNHLRQQLYSNTHVGK